MTPAELASYARFLTQTDSVTLTDTELKLLTNIAIDNLAGEVTKINEDYFGVPATTDLVADQREYPFPDDMLAGMKRVEVAFDPTTPLVFIRLKELDLTQYKKGTDEATITANFTNAKDNASFDIFRKAIRIFSGTIVGVTGGLKLWSFQFPAHVTDLSSSVDMAVDPSATSAGFPRPLHELLGREISILFKSSKEVPIPLSEREQLYEMDLQKKLETLKSMDLDREVLGSVPKNDGSQY